MPREINQLKAHSLKPIVKDLSLCLLSALLLILSFPGFNLEFLAWFGFVPVFLALENKTLKQAFFLFFITGIIFWWGIIYWLVHVTLAGTIVLVFYLALYFSVFGLIIRPFTRRSNPYVLIFIPSIWVLLEFSRTYLFTGFPWALLGYSQYLNLPVIQIADITGAWGISFLVMMINVAIVEALTVKKRRTFTALFCFVVISIVIAYGYFRLQPVSASRSPAIKVSVIQGNIPQQLKWEEGARDFIMKRYLSISKEALRDNPGLVIWPEAALPVVLEEEPSYFEKIRDFAKDSKAPLLLGAVTLRNNLYYNSALLISKEGELLKKYDKLHLVPFGEYIPLRRVFSFLETIVPIGDFSKGREFTVFTLPDTSPRAAKFSVLICFEDLFPELSTQFVKRGAGFLVNITNDAWFKKTSSPYQHLSASVFRAVENRVFVVRAANTGVSGFIAPTGRITSLVADNSGNNIFIRGYKSEEVFPLRQNYSFYTQCGNIFVAACLLFSLCGVVIFLKKPRQAG